jgi:hypothetical protein
MTKILTKPLKSWKQLTEIAQGRPIEGGFDESNKYFTIVFKINAIQKADITIDFSGRLPRLLVSNAYVDDSEV